LETVFVAILPKEDTMTKASSKTFGSKIANFCKAREICRKGNKGEKKRKARKEAQSRPGTRRNLVTICSRKVKQNSSLEKGTRPEEDQKLSQKIGRKGKHT